MSFIQEINSLLGIDGITQDVYITFMASKGAVVQGYKKLLEITDTKLVVIGKNKRKIQICGHGLEIFSLAPSEIVVHGKICFVGEIDE